ATITYWLLLGYMIAALVWWFISLEKQNDEMKAYQVVQLHASTTVAMNSPAYEEQLQTIEKAHRRNFVKYVSEGSTFLLLIIIGAAFVYRSVRRQLRFQLQQQNFMMAITHELKTPISVAQLNLETMQKHHLDPARQGKLIRMTLDETERLNALINNILISSQLEGAGYEILREDIDLGDLVHHCVGNFSRRFPERTFHEEIEPGLDITGDPLLLELLTNNLVENAVKYSPKEEPIRCVLRREDGHITLHVIDHGPGVPVSERKNVFRKFYRMGNEATRQAAGTGLGLYLCKIIAEDHRAQLTILPNTPAGSDFRVIFSQ
ncbi:MAG TPA: ATP-binding protein, partial [Chitinophagaceae bacterium]